ncbi:MAG TPA: serine/threonine-protein kinase [Blastocatellia bacterium]|nr:serine/threonine-protein kinase [Blastocatellia bacterium]
MATTHSRTDEVSTTGRADRKHPFFWVALGFGIVVFLLYVFAGAMIIEYGSLGRGFGWSYVTKSDGCYVNYVGASSDSARTVDRLQVGDKVLAINNDAIVGSVYPLRILREIPPDGAYTVRVLRGTSEHEYSFTLSVEHDSKNFIYIIPKLLVGIAFFVVGFLIGVLKPEQRIAQIAAVSSIANAILFLSIAIGPTILTFPHGFQLAIGLFLIQAVNPLPVAIGYHFFLRIPTGTHKGRFWELLRVIFYACGIVLCAIFTLQNYSFFTANPTLMSVFYSGSFASRVTTSDQAYRILALVAYCVILVRNYRLVTDVDQHRRMKWVVYGSVLGILPELLILISRVTLNSLGHGQILSTDTFVALNQVANAAIGIVPVTWGYAIIKHRLFDINVVVRRGLQYLLAKNVLQILLVLPLVAFAYTIISNRNQTISDIVSHNPVYLSLIALAAIGLRFRKQLRDRIDRKFFREAYDQERILLGLIDEIKEFNSMSEISKLVSDEIEAALHPHSIHAFYREEEHRDLTLAYSSAGSSHVVSIPETSHLMRTIERVSGVQEYPFSHDDALPAEEAEWLDQLGISLIVPMCGTDQRAVGLLLLGEKKSEEPYSANDRKMLQAIAREIAIVRENTLLKARVNKEQKIKREVLARFEEQNINLVKECPACGTCYDSSSERCDKDASELSLSLPVERTIDGKYRLERLIGKGGMGAVYQATDLRLHRNVAIKIMLGSMFGDPMALRRFEREARMSARLNHINIIAIYDYGAIGSEGAYLVMELVPGITLRSDLAQKERIDPATAADYFDQILDGVKAAHEAAVIHRDLKPENILISRDKDKSRIKILDFGLAKVAQIDVINSSLTARGSIVGTFGYMSPEQLTGEDVDERSDIFSIGVMVVEALTGRRPFFGRTQAELLTAMLHGSYHLEGESKEVKALDAILQRCLAKNPARRFTSVTDLQQRLVPAIRDCRLIAGYAADLMNEETRIIGELKH